jgi:hypothetical protein
MNFVNPSLLTRLRLAVFANGAENPLCNSSLLLAGNIPAKVDSFAALAVRNLRGLLPILLVE